MFVTTGIIITIPEEESVYFAFVLRRRFPKEEENLLNLFGLETA